MLIAFVGSVFSPYYAMARRRGPADPRRHAALNVALYGPRARWAMTERGHVRQDARTLTIGPSAVTWEGDHLRFEIDEVTAPWPRRLRGVVRVHPRRMLPQSYALDAAERHRWQPIAPVARVEVDLQRPALRFSGAGYLDTNAGSEPLESAFSRWDWSCARHGEDAVVIYDSAGRDGGTSGLALRFGAAGVEPFEPPPRIALPPPRWGVTRVMRGEEPDSPRLVRTLEDGPFYVRSEVETRLLGRTVTAMHESLSLDRFRQPWVQALLPFRMPRTPRR